MNRSAIIILSILWMTKRLIASSFFFTPCHFRCSAVSDVTSLLLRSPSPWLHQLLPFLSLVTPECGCGWHHLHRRHDYQSLSLSTTQHHHHHRDHHHHLLPLLRLVTSGVKQCLTCVGRGLSRTHFIDGLSSPNHHHHDHDHDYHNFVGLGYHSPISYTDSMSHNHHDH